jgi:hypothetical protein
MMEELLSSETSVPIRATRRDIPEDSILEYSTVYVSGHHTKRQKVLDWMIANIALIRPSLNLLLNQIIFELLHIFKGSVSLSAIFIWRVCPALRSSFSKIHHKLGSSSSRQPEGLDVLKLNRPPRPVSGIALFHLVLLRCTICVALWTDLFFFVLFVWF